MHKTRAFLPPITPITPGSYDLYTPHVRLVALPRTSLDITGDFEKYTQDILDGAARNAQKPLEVPEGFVVVPVHELQVHHIQDKFQEAKIFPEEFSVAARAQQSIRYCLLRHSAFQFVDVNEYRSMILPGTLTDTSLKLGVGIKLTSAVRTISPASAYLGPRFSSQVVPVLKIDRSILTVARELASVVHTHPNSEIAKHCATIVRECHENVSEARGGERLIVCTALVESGHADAPDGVPSVVRVFKLDTEAKRIAWLDEYVTPSPTFFPTLGAPPSTPVSQYTPPSIRHGHL